MEDAQTKLNIQYKGILNTMKQKLVSFLNHMQELKVPSFN